MIYVVFKFDKVSKEWKEIKRFRKLMCAKSFVGLVSRDSDDLFCIEARDFARSDYAGVV